MSAALRTFSRCIGRALAVGCLFWAATSMGTADSVMIKKRAPLENLSATGEMTGVRESTVGASYTLVSSDNGKVTLMDAQGNLFRITLAATDYTPPPPSTRPTPAPPSTNVTPADSPTAASTNVTAAPAADSPTSASTNVATAPATDSSVLAATNAATSSATNSSSASERPYPPKNEATATPSASSPTDHSANSINASLGKPIFSAQPLWQEPALLVAQRLGLGLEGRTKWDVSYRRYFSGQADDKKAAMLGTGAYCVVIYADAADHPTSLLIAFANDGDFHGVGKLAAEIDALLRPSPSASNADNSKRERDLLLRYEEAKSSFEPARKAEEVKLVANLTALFGEPKRTVFGSDEVTKENTLRWDWNDASFLLTCYPKKYNLLRIVPTKLADNNGRTERIPRDDIGKKLSEAVEHRPNGDTVITQLPMANQGFKGYCVPATWERVLRYTGVPGDMYTLSRIGQSRFGGGAYGLNIADQLDKTLHDYGRHVQILHPSKLDAVAVRRYIDDGVPIFWAVNPNGYEASLQRYSLCDRNKDWEQWKKLLEQTRSTPPDKHPLPDDEGHQVLITGYNTETKELAWSDPWGKDTAERWMTVEEAQRCSLNEFYTISW